MITIVYDDGPIAIENPLASAFFYNSSGSCVPIQRNGYLTPTTEEERITLNTVRKQLINTQFSKTYEEFSSHPVVSKETRRDPTAVFIGTPLETPHNTCHDVIGGTDGNMSDISISAFDPLFWLHHCNMDRFYYNWMYKMTDGFKKPLHMIEDSTRESGHAPFFPTKESLYATNPHTYNYGWMNNTGMYQILGTTLHLEKFPYTYEEIVLPTTVPLPVSSYINILNIPIPMKTIRIKAYLVRKGTVLNHETDFAGVVVWLGLNRAERHCSRCDVTRTDLQIDITEACARRGIHAGNASEYETILEAFGLTHEQILQDGILTVKIQ